jgi:hypothetical protein
MTQRANDFIIWRSGASVNWECTAKDIADEVGMSSANVLSICRRRGWKLQHGQKGQNFLGRQGIDHIMASPYKQGRGAT